METLLGAVGRGRRPQPAGGPGPLARGARAAPEDMRGGATGGVLSFGQVGALALPLLYSGLLDLTGSYGIGFIVCGVPALLVGVQLLRQRASS